MTKIMVNGTWQDSIAVLNRGLHYADGLFETIKMQQGKPQFWQRHLRRLQHGCQALGLVCPAENSLYAELQQVSASWPMAVAKIILARRWQGRGYYAQRPSETERIVLASAYQPPTASQYATGWRLRICQTPASINAKLAGIKHLARLEQVMARSEWQDTYDEGIMLNPFGQIIEATSANIFFIYKETLLSPDLSNSGVKGILRELVLEQAKSLGISTVIRDIPLNEISDFSEVFICNSLIGIMPIRQIDSYSYNVGDLTQELKEGVACLEP